MNTLRLWIGLALMTSPAFAAVRLPAVFSDRMVMQSGVKVPIWGWADAGERVKIDLAGQSVESTAAADGKWRAEIAPLAPGGPHKIVVSGSNRIEINDVLVGEVWLGSGQSNMAMRVNGAKDFEKEKAAADLPQIRVFTTASQNTPKPADDCKGTWTICSPETVGTFSATAFFFGREIHREQKVPVGLIVSAVGGTPIDSWVDQDLQRSLPEMKGYFSAQASEAAIDPVKANADFEAAMAKWKEDVKQARADKKPLPRRPVNPADLRAKKSNLGGLFNGMIMPLVPYAIRGALWYQGEANTVPTKAPYYQYQLPALVTDWRKRWGAEFPFAWVQLPNYAGNGRDLPQVREGMLKTLRLPKTGMAITIDIGETGNIHPRNKQEVGRRLSVWALNTVYGKADIESSGPLPEKHEVRGSDVVVHFSHARGLKARDGEVTGFQIAGEDQQWQPATARVEGETVIVSSPSVSKPVAVRYAWENDPKCNLYNAAGMPASPFRTDDWKLPVIEQPPVVRRPGKKAAAKAP
jgi:sialate O-acetylesterase